jgi:hypothetical protein
LVVCLVPVTVPASDVVSQLDVDGKRYHDVRWGTLNQGKVVIFHNRGVAVVSADKLPPEYQALLGYKPAPAPAQPPPPVVTLPKPPATETSTVNQVLESMRSRRTGSQAESDWAAYSRERASKVLLDGKLVERATLKELTGFLIKTSYSVEAEGQRLTGAVLDLARRRKDTGHVAVQMELRPSLWEPTGVRVLLREYLPVGEIGDLLRVYAAEDPPLGDRVVYRAGKEPTYEEWRALTRSSQRP